jgi:hypothetical protein
MFFQLLSVSRKIALSPRQFDRCAQLFELSVSLPLGCANAWLFWAGICRPAQACSAGELRVRAQKPLVRCYSRLGRDYHLSWPNPIREKMFKILVFFLASSRVRH